MDVRILFPRTYLVIVYVMIGSIWHIIRKIIGIFHACASSSPQAFLSRKAWERGYLITWSLSHKGTPTLWMYGLEGEICESPFCALVYPFLSACVSWTSNCLYIPLQDPSHIEVCSCGVARMAVRTGDIRRLALYSLQLLHNHKVQLYLVYRDCYGFCIQNFTSYFHSLD